MNGVKDSAGPISMDFKQMKLDELKEHEQGILNLISAPMSPMSDNKLTREDVRVKCAFIQFLV